jgi:predicted HNH restriction endonuclease
MEYSNYLKSSYWQNLKSELKNLGWYRVCYICEYNPSETNHPKYDPNNKISLHHMSYQNMGNKDKEIKDLVPLCLNCHDTLHMIIRYYNKRLGDHRILVERMKNEQNIRHCFE